MPVEHTERQVDFDLTAVLEGGLVGTRFQPIISMREKAVIGMEALSFGLHPDGGRIIPPLQLFHEAESQGKTLDGPPVPGKGSGGLCRTLWPGH